MIFLSRPTFKLLAISAIFSPFFAWPQKNGLKISDLRNALICALLYFITDSFFKSSYLQIITHLGFTRQFFFSKKSYLPSLTYYYRSTDNYWTLDPICTVPRDIAWKYPVCQTPVSWCIFILFECKKAMSLPISALPINSSKYINQMPYHRKCGLTTITKRNKWYSTVLNILL